MVVIVTAVIPAVITEVQAQPEVLSLGGALLNFIIGYAATYRILDGLNDGTKSTIKAKEAQAQIEE